jgi:hypothetical protein
MRNLGSRFMDKFALCCLVKASLHLSICPSIGEAFSDKAYTKALRDMGYGERATAHGFRTCFKTWAAETGVRDEVS